MSAQQVCHISNPCQLLSAFWIVLSLVACLLYRELFLQGARQQQGLLTRQALGQEALQHLRQRRRALGVLCLLVRRHQCPQVGSHDVRAKCPLSWPISSNSYVYDAESRHVQEHVSSCPPGCCCMLQSVNREVHALAGSTSCDVNSPNCCADNVSSPQASSDNLPWHVSPITFLLPMGQQFAELTAWSQAEARCHSQGLNSRLVPVTSNATLTTLAGMFFKTVPAGGGFIATPVTSSGAALMEQLLQHLWSMKYLV